jgi:hypothetical protein
MRRSSTDRKSEEWYSSLDNFRIFLMEKGALLQLLRKIVLEAGL